jgi:lipopolysaccharide transport system permease protein
MVTNVAPHFPEDHRSSKARANSWLLRWVHRRDLLRELIARDMKLRYRGSALGVAWTLLNPLAELLVLLFIFSVVLPLNIPNYGSFLFTGLLVYSWFQSSLNFATGAIVNNRELIRRPGVPSGILPIVTVASTLLHFILSLPALVLLLMISNTKMTSAVLALPALIAVQFVLILSLAYPLATVHVWFRDTQYFLRIALQLLFYLTPIFYEARTIPDRFKTLYNLNPMMHVVEGYRDVLLRGKYPEWRSLLLISVVSAGVLYVGVAMFRHTSHRFGDEL